MNIEQLNKLFHNYIARFDEISFGKNDETYKWEIVQKFQDEFNLSAPDFSSMLRNLWSASENLIDNSTQLPFFALVDYAQHEPDTVRQMFADLYTDDGGDLTVRQNKIEHFISKTEELRHKYKPDSWRYVNDQRSVMSYLFLYDPDHNYLYKSTQAHEFADCVEFYDDIGYGSDFKLPVYYRMCDELVKEMQSCDELLTVHKTRFDGKRKLYPDNQLHILSFDMIYSSQVYGLYNGIEYTHLSSAERRQYREREAKAVELFTVYQAAQDDMEKLDEVKAYLAKQLHIGDTIHHKSFHEGIVESFENGYVSIKFSEQIGVKRFEAISALAGGFIMPQTLEFSEYIKVHSQIMKSANSLPNRLKRAEADLEPYREYL